MLLLLIAPFKRPSCQLLGLAVLVEAEMVIDQTTAAFVVESTIVWMCLWELYCDYSLLLLLTLAALSHTGLTPTVICLSKTLWTINNIF